MDKGKKLQRKGECPSCKGSVVGIAESSHGFCTSCGARVEGERAEPTDAIKKAVREVLSEYDLKPKEKEHAKEKQPVKESEADDFFD